MKKLFTLFAGLIMFFGSAFAVDHLYLIGQMQGWDPEHGIEMTKGVGDVFTYTLEKTGSDAWWFAFTSVSSADWSLVNANRWGGDPNGANVSTLGSFTMKKADWSFTVSAAGTYELTVDLTNLRLTVSAAGPAPVTYNYYLVGTLAENGWDVNSAMGMENDEITRSVAAGTYEFKVIPTLGSWQNELGFSNVNAECSSAGYKSSGSNVQVTLSEDGDVHVAIVDGHICVTGNFGEAVITSYTLAGYADLFGQAWEPAATANDMVENDGVWTLVKKGLALSAGSYQYKVAANHSWDVSNYPTGEESQLLVISEAGVYDVTFTWNPETPELTAVATKTYTVNFSNNWASFCAAEKVAIPEAVVAYKGAVNGDVLTLTPVEGNVIPANEGVMLKSTAASATLTVSEETAADFTGNQLQGTTEDTPAPANAYCYSKSQNAFAPVAAGFSIPANKAYLVLASAPERISIVEADHNFVTAVENVEMKAEVKKVVVNGQMMILRGGNMFDLNGRIVK